MAEVQAEEEKHKFDASLITYAEPTGTAVNWKMIYDGSGNEVSFEEARAMHRAIRAERSITVTVRFLTRQSVTVRCAPADWVQNLIERALARLKQMTNKFSGESRRNKQPLKLEPSSYVMVHQGMELAKEVSLEHCGVSCIKDRARACGVSST